MAENETNSVPNDATTEERQISVNAQYIKDLSFENPKAPVSLVPTKDKPTIDISVDVKATKAGETSYEVTISITAKTKREEETLFVVELEYAGVFTIKGVPEAEIKPALLIFCPNLLFPYARNIVSDVTRNGGFPPLMMDPIDFGRLYMQRVQEEENESKSA